ncbi:MAG TPA: BtpA/SgcQ family protein [Candidatus Paceibacterota bacterium]|nr:BtpA/SgcQ family protein [Candidatus Paceibacterota bacterium]
MENPDQAVRNARIAINEGADGVFLINHHISADDLLSSYEAVLRRVPTAWIGVNYLRTTATEAVQYMRSSMNGLWVDNAGVYEDARGSQEAATLFKTQQELERMWQGEFLLFGGVAFKGQESVKDPARMAKLAMPYVDVITTSGVATGFAPPVDKIRLMREAIGEHPLAIASGMTPENVHKYLPYTDAFLVATGISKSFTELDPKKVAQFVKALC